jgi:hypothetical protein
MGVPKTLSPNHSSNRLDPNSADVLVLFPGDNKDSALPSAARWDRFLSRCSPGPRPRPLLCVCSLTLHVLDRQRKNKDMVLHSWYDLTFKCCEHFQVSEEHLSHISRYAEATCLPSWFAVAGVHCFTDQSQCFARAVAPVYYAHLAAAQVRQFVRFDDASETASSASGGQASSTSGGQAPPVPELPRLHPSVRSSMFFCWVKQRSGADVDDSGCFLDWDTCLHVRTAEPALNVLLPLDLAATTIFLPHLFIYLSIIMLLQITVVLKGPRSLRGYTITRFIRKKKYRWICWRAKRQDFKLKAHA